MWNFVRSVVVLMCMVTSVHAEDFAAPTLVFVPGGPFVMGSDRVEREAAYQMDEAAYGHSATRQGRWYEGELARHSVTTPAFSITTTPITNLQYAAFVTETGHGMPTVDAQTWAMYGLAHPFSRTQKFSWTKGQPPKGRAQHPVVLVSHGDAVAYAAWLSQKTGNIWRLPDETEWEKAVRGTTGYTFPWGATFHPERLNSHDKGPFDTTNVGLYPTGASPFGLLDGSGQVYEWTQTPTASGARYVVKGGSWDDQGCGVCRPAARHTRPQHLKHILIGIRLVCENCTKH